MKKVSTIKTLTELDHSDCRWPIGDPRQEGFHFCGAQQMLGRPYCKEHALLACDTLKPRHAPSTPAFAIRRAA